MMQPALEFSEEEFSYCPSCTGDQVSEDNICQYHVPTSMFIHSIKNCYLNKSILPKRRMPITEGWDNMEVAEWGKKENVFQPTDDLTACVISVIGENGLNRFYEFRDQYKNGWDNGRGKSLSPSSTACLIYFFSQFETIRGYKPSLFLTRNGNLQISWEDKKGGEIEIEFYHDKLEFYIESIDKEGAVSRENIEELIHLL